jgi:hypothetical protein
VQHYGIKSNGPVHHYAIKSNGPVHHYGIKSNGPVDVQFQFLLYSTLVGGKRLASRHGRFTSADKLSLPIGSEDDNLKAICEPTVRVSTSHNNTSPRPGLLFASHTNAQLKHLTPASVRPSFCGSLPRPLLQCIDSWNRGQSLREHTEADRYED